jgi:transcriptional regulator NrdR family protein
MAKEEIAFNTTVTGVEKTISSFKDLKTAIKAAKDEQIAMTSKFGENSIEATKAGQKLAGLKDKVEDLNDSTKSLKGSGVEKLTSSFRLLGEGIGTFDFDKIKTGFKGVGAAMGAIPIFLLIEGIKLLYDNFETIAAMFDKTSLAEKALADVTKEVSGELSKVLEGVQNVESGFAAFHKGTITRDEALKIYNETLGGTLGTTNDLALAESNFVANKDLYIEAMQAKSTANVLFAKSAEAQAKVLTGEAAATDVVPWYEKTYAYVSSIGLNLQADMNEYSKKVVEYGNIHSKETQQFADDTKKLGQTELEKSEAIFNSLKTNGEKAGLVTKQSVSTNKKATEDKFADEKRLLEDIEKAKEESYLRSLKSDEARAVAKAQFDNDRLIEYVNKSKAHQSVKDESLKQLAIKLESDLLIIQNDFQAKRVAQEKADQVKKDADDTAFRTKQLSDADIDNKKWVANYLSNKESAYQLELEKIEGNDLLKLQKEQEHLDEVYQMNIDTADLLKTNKIDLDNKYAKDKIALEKRIAAETKKIKQDEIKQGFENVKNGLQAAQGLSDIYFTIKSAKVKGDAAKEEALARKQFNIQKAFNLAKVGMDGYMAISNIIATTPKADFGISTGILLAASAISTAANLAKIGAAQFEGGASAPATSPESAASIPSTTSQAPAIYGPGQGQSTTFSGNQNNNFGPVKAYVVETENRSTTNRVNKLVSESTYG